MTQAAGRMAVLAVIVMIAACGRAADSLESIRAATMLPSEATANAGQPIDVEGLAGRVLCGYQGWFNTPADGAGLGIRFLKHLQRTRLLLHMVDVLPPDESDIAENVRVICNELIAFSGQLADREQWLVFNKIDLLPDEQRQPLIDRTLAALNWSGRWFAISAVTRQGCDVLCREAMAWVDAQAPRSEDQLDPPAAAGLDDPQPPVSDAGEPQAD